ncbi:hypothetical protein F503_08029 [Ophiostoma piceae UAMH 11346]|uniref:Large ribosomal subunit protein mL50 n=1 Tax=Ophiostoma piceae (strain UAMH 11346) TaxID=1262450 RepID=S3CLI8_OPHP1|nr:hypothetical protein F503_08029 [Ophiostoma piceae UAMH 11346]
MRRIARLPKPVAKAVAVAGPVEFAVARSASSPACRTFHSHSRTSTSPTAHASTHTPRHIAATSQLYCPSPSSGLARRFLTTETTANKTESETENKAEDTVDITEAEFDAAVEAEQQDAVYLSAAAAAQNEPVLVVPGETETAPRPTEIADSNYQPAASADGLETVGGIDGWWENDAHWDNAVELRGFAPRRPVTDAAVLQVLARRAVLETVAVQQLASEGLAQAWSRGGAAEQSSALALEVDVAADGSVAGLRGEAAAVVESLRVTETLSGPDSAATLTGDEAQSLLTSWDPSWKSISLADPLFKFTVIKRIFQLTGHMMPDAQLALADDVAGLLAVLVRPPKAKKLAEELAKDGELAGLPNVAVYGRRVTPVDRHKMVGRWKVIVEELEKRDLPVTGTGGYSKAVERKWAFH